jgi:GDP-L-fucose synthase
MPKSVGIVGHADSIEAGLWDYFTAAGFRTVSTVRAGVDARDRAAMNRFWAEARPQWVIVTSVRSGGIGANQQFPAEFIDDNLQAQGNAIDAAYRNGVRKLLYLAASCVYPKDCPQPMKEEYFQTGPMEPTSAPYSMAKAAGVLMCQAYRRQYGFPAIVGVPATVYGPGGHEDPKDAHVLGSMAVKFCEAVRRKQERITFWGTGAPRREFIHARDLASSCHFLLENYDSAGMINIGTGSDVAIRDLADMIRTACGFTGQVEWDTSKPDGALRKLLDSSRLRALGWRPAADLPEGISAVVRSLLI